MLTFYGASLATKFLDQGNFDLKLGTSLLAGNLIGVMVGSNLSKSKTYTRTEATALSVTGFLGGLVGPTTVYSADAFSTEELDLGTTLGGIAGLGLGHALAINNNFTSQEGPFVLYTVAGAAFGGGVGLMLTPDDTPRLRGKANPVTRNIFIGASIGGISGYILGLRHLKLKHHEIDGQASVEVNFNPAGLFANEPYNPKFPMGRQPSTLQVRLSF